MKTQHVGTITKLDILRAPKGHQSTISGCGFHRNRRKDRKIARLEGKKACHDI